VVGISLLITLTVWVSGISPGFAAKSPQPVLEQGEFDAAWTPMGLSSVPINVVVQLARDPVSVADSNGVSRLTDQEKDQMKGEIKASQEPLERQIEGVGGKVLADYQLAYNGVKVQIAPNQIRTLAKLPGVVKVHRLTTYSIDNTKGVAYIGAPEVWGGTSAFHGEGIKIAIIDSGIDYTHADVGGPGTVAAWENAFSKSTLDPTLLTVCETPDHKPCFGPNAPKVKGGWDFVGDSYNADPNSTTAPYQPIPHPDPNPLDCYGHGSHVAGTAAGYGVLADGTTFTGPYNATTISSNSWNVGPGVAPMADLYAIRVFGCAGSTDVVIDAIEWAVEHHMDVINMSLGSSFGTAENPEAVAASNAAKDGLIVVSSAGNSGAAPYMTGSPASGTYGISVAAADAAKATLPGVLLTLGAGPTTVQAINANGATFTDGTTWPLMELKNATGNLSLGCDSLEYTAQNVAGKAVITKRGSCARVARAIFGQMAGAKAVIMVNTDSGYPAFEGPITGNPDNGVSYTVTIPFLGVPNTSGAALHTAAAAGQTVTLTSNLFANPTYGRLATFSSFGPRSGDSASKPEVTAPGVSIASVGMGTGNKSVFNSGTSMAAPHTAGMAALVKQAHPDWKSEDLKAAIVSTANPSRVTGYGERGAGTGLIQAPAATRTQVVALGEPGTSALSFGFKELDTNFSQTEQVKLTNHGDAPATFTVSSGLKGGQPHSIALGSIDVTVPAHETVSVEVTLAVPVATAGDSTKFHDVRGMVTFTPATGQNNGVTLRVPYYLVPNAISHTNVKLDTNQMADSGSATASITNSRGAATGLVDFFAWGLARTGERKDAADDRDAEDLGSAGLRAAGVQSYPTEQLIQFAIGTTARWSNPSENEFDILVDVNGDGIPDYMVVVADLGRLTTKSFNGVDAVAVFPVKVVDGAVVKDGNASILFLAGVTMNGSSLEVPVRFSQLCRTGHPCLSPNVAISYSVASFGLTTGAFDSLDGSASFNAFTPVFTNTSGSDTVLVPRNGTVSETVTFNPGQAAKTPVLGVMIVSQNNPNRNGRDGQIQLISGD
jgi:subtilisin family serine protease